MELTAEHRLELLRRFAPTLHFDALERWRPDRIDEYLLRSTARDAENRVLPDTPPAEPAMLERGDERKARLNPLAGELDLDTRRRSNEMLVAYGRDRDLREAGTAYGRVLPAPGGRFLQYWLFYPDNPCVLPDGRHDGDWELVQVRVERDGDGWRATQVTLAGHGKPVTRSIARGDGEAGPDVFVAVDSHACYHLEGAHPMLPLSDVCQPAGAGGVKPIVEPLPIAADKRDWAHWSGRWGIDRGPGTRLALRLRMQRTPWPLTRLNDLGAGESPPSPGRQGASWRFPKAFALDGTRRKLSTKLVQRFAHYLGRASWPRGAPHVRVTPAGEGGDGTTYAIEVEASGRFLRRLAFVSISFVERRADGSARPLAMHSLRPGRHELSIPHGGELTWRAAGYNRLRQRGEPVSGAAT